MDSTLTSTGPQQDASSLNRARRAALGSFAGAVVDWYDFLLYGITAALVLTTSSSRKSAQRWGHLPHLLPLASDFCSVR